MKPLDKSDFRQMVIEKDGSPITTSLKVAQFFGKTHAKVLRAIRMLECSSEFTEANFGLSDYMDSTGRKLPMYTMTKNGFIFLVMGFTGKKAAEVKENYIGAFDWMYDRLNNISQSYMEMINRLSLQYNQEKSVASFAGKALRKWQISKPLLTVRIEELERSGQRRLLLN